MCREGASAPSPCSPAVGVGTGEAGAEQGGNGWESGCALSLMHPSDVACLGLAGENRGPSLNLGAHRRQRQWQSPAAPGPALGGGGPVGVASL